MSGTEQAEPSPEESRITTLMAQDRPTIDAAVKSFLSLICARSMTASNTDAQSMLIGIVKTGDVHTAPVNEGVSASQQQQALQVARAILQSCNSFEFPVHQTVADELIAKPGLTEAKRLELLEISVVARLWNGLVQSKQKPTRFLGRKALRHAWGAMEVAAKLPKPADETEDLQKVYQQQLSWLQEFEQLLLHVSYPNTTVDDDSALIWDAPS